MNTTLPTQDEILNAIRYTNERLYKTPTAIISIPVSRNDAIGCNKLFREHQNLFSLRALSNSGQVAALCHAAAPPVKARPAEGSPNACHALNLSV
jgi:uncharacterized FlgJ-related protein